MKKRVNFLLIIASICIMMLLAIIIMLSLKIRGVTFVNQYLWQHKFELEEQLNDMQIKIDSLESYQWNNFIKALIQVESSGRDNAKGDNNNSWGCLQIQKVYIDYVNEYGGYSFTYDDRLSCEKSIQILEAMQNLRNPNRNIEIAVQLHNPKAGYEYRGKIFKEMFGN